MRDESEGYEYISYALEALVNNEIPPQERQSKAHNLGGALRSVMSLPVVRKLLAWPGGSFHMLCARDDMTSICQG